MSRPAEHVAPSVIELLGSGAGIIGEASDTPDLDARVLLQTILRKDHAWLIAHPHKPIASEDAQRYYAWIKRRSKSEPVAYITGHKEFWSLDLMVSPDVLIPRPETELLVQRALDKIPLSESLTIADLGTGSGAIALAIAGERPLCKVIATDISRAALKLAEENKARLGLRNVDFKQGDWYAAVGQQRFSVIVCNPPYVPESHYAAALSYEPSGALFAGRRGMDSLTTVIKGAPRHLERNGWLLVEHGFDQHDPVQSLFESQGFMPTETLDDYAGQPRTTQGRKGTRS
ncbi:MAG: peptide chain release factor N(5)-glutamine methyltransferase [Arenicellales bacterium]